MRLIVLSELLSDGVDPFEEELYHSLFVVDRNENRNDRFAR
jgi:hypothetical protein